MGGILSSPPKYISKNHFFILLPLSFLYTFILICKRIFSTCKDFQIPIISVGNLTVGGSGKTPLILSLAHDFHKPAIILRGYKRKSKGLHVISLFGKIQADLNTSGDEAMLYATSLKNALVIVSEDRIKAIKKAKELGANLIFLDDGFSKANIKKFDILIEPNPYPKNTFTIPSGAFREPLFVKKYANLILKEHIDFERKVSISNQTDNMSLVTAIANAKRLDMYLPKGVTNKHIFPDHHSFSKKELEQILHVDKVSSLLVTRKDWVKIKDFDLPLSFLELEFVVNKNIIQNINDYVKQYQTKK